MKAKNERLGHLCFIIGLGWAMAFALFMYVYVINKSFISIVSSCVVSLLLGFYISMDLAKYLEKEVDENEIKNIKRP